MDNITDDFHAWLRLPVIEFIWQKAPSPREVAVNGAFLQRIALTILPRFLERRTALYPLTSSNTPLCSRKIHTPIPKADAAPPLSALRDTFCFPAAVLGPVDFDQGAHLRIAIACFAFLIYHLNCCGPESESVATRQGEVLAVNLNFRAVIHND